jgi:hypothetical protein
MVKYGTKLMVVFKDTKGNSYRPVNNIYADELIRDRENGYLTLQMKEEHMFFTTHVQSVRLTRDKVGEFRANIAYVTLSL